MNNNIVRWGLRVSLIVLIFILMYVWVFYISSSHSDQGVPISKTYSVPSTLESAEVIVNPVRFDGFLLNPGMGWQRDNSSTSGYFPESVAYADRQKIPWKILNPAENVYDWSALDFGLTQAVMRGEQFSFRVFTMSGESYGGHEVPDWVLQAGAVILENGEPDYSNCVYQQEWGKFVNALLERYDGNPSIAYIDISGYGNFNEWSWQDQTEWDTSWDENYQNGTADSKTLETLDGQARRRLVDMFIGGSYSAHRCRLQNGQIQTVSYEYGGARKSQLIMPYAGITQSTQYVLLRRKDVGFRYDCLGRRVDLPVGVSLLWRTAPVIYEFCSPDEFDVNIAKTTIDASHPVLIHNNDFRQSRNALNELVWPIGYRFFLKEARFESVVRSGDEFILDMTWQNLGTSVPYKKMGQQLSLHSYLVNRATNQVAYENRADVDPTLWFPGDSSTVFVDYHVNVSFVIPASLSAGDYVLDIALIDDRTSLPIRLAMDGQGETGRFSLHTISVVR
jgi:Domain of unknown function (DUF4832)